MNEDDYGKSGLERVNTEFTPYSVGIDFRRQILTSMEWCQNLTSTSIPVPKEDNIYNCRRPIGIHMTQKGLTKTCMMI